MTLVFGSHKETPVASSFDAVCRYQNNLDDPIFKMISRCDALNFLVKHLNLKSKLREIIVYNVIVYKGLSNGFKLFFLDSHCRIGEFNFMTRAFFRGLVFALFKDFTEPSNQLLAADLLHIVCRNIYRALSSIGHNG